MSGCVESCQRRSGESGLIGVNSPSVCVSQHTGSLAETSPATGEAERGITIPHLLSRCLYCSFPSCLVMSLCTYDCYVVMLWLDRLYTPGENIRPSAKHKMKKSSQLFVWLTDSVLKCLWSNLVYRDGTVPLFLCFLGPALPSAGLRLSQLSTETSDRRKINKYTNILQLKKMSHNAL